MTEFDVSTGTHRVEVPGEQAIEMRWASATDTGRKREVNQDALITSYPLFAVADGMGGHEAGEVASAAVIARFAEAVSGEETIDRAVLEDALRSAVDDMFDAVGESDLGTGTTVTGMLFTTPPDAPASWSVFNIGDSRVYRLHDDELVQVTLDHSVVQELIAIGAITPDEAETHPHGNVITRAVGFSEEPVPDYTEVAPVVGARWLICSDGLTKELTDFGLKHFLTKADTPEQAVRTLLSAALENGGRDNISVVVLDERAPTESVED